MSVCVGVWRRHFPQSDYVLDLHLPASTPLVLSWELHIHESMVTAGTSSSPHTPERLGIPPSDETRYPITAGWTSGTDEKLLPIRLHSAWNRTGISGL